MMLHVKQHFTFSQAGRRAMESLKNHSFAHPIQLDELSLTCRMTG